MATNAVKCKVSYFKEFDMSTIAFIVAAYLIGSLPFAVIVSKTMGLSDPRSYGSKNPGATNVLRSGNKKAAALTLFGDAAKGWLAVFLAQQFGPRHGLAEPEFAMVALAVFAGHLWPLFLRFRGGKGVATALGVLVAVNPLIALSSAAVWLLIAATTRYSSLAAILAAIAAPVATAFIQPGVYFGAIVVIALLLVRKHKQNILNLLSGQEGRIGAGKTAANGEQDS